MHTLGISEHIGNGFTSSGKEDLTLANNQTVFWLQHIFLSYNGKSKLLNLEQQMNVVK